MARIVLILLFSGILVAMLGLTTYASLDRSIFNLSPHLTSDPWFHATLADVYFGFLTFYVWVAYKEPTAWRKGLWFVLIMALGNIATSILRTESAVALGPSAGSGVDPFTGCPRHRRRESMR